MTENVYLAILLASIATYICRATGVFLSDKLSINSELFEIIRCVSMGIIIAVIFKIIIYPEGILGATSSLSRSAAGVSCIIFFYLFKKNILLSTFLSTSAFYFLNFFLF